MQAKTGGSWGCGQSGLYSWTRLKEHMALFARVIFWVLLFLSVCIHSLDVLTSTSTYKRFLNDMQTSLLKATGNFNTVWKLFMNVIDVLLPSL